MKETLNPSAKSAELRRRAVHHLRQQQTNQKSAANGPQPEADAERMLHELQVHQIELEMQNTELQGARDRMEAQLEKYTDLYDFAPVGYFSLDETGVVLEANLTGAALLGEERSRFLNRRLSRFMSPANQSDFLAFLKNVFAGTGKQDCDLNMVKTDGTTLWTRLRGTFAMSVSDPRKWCRVSVADITVIKQAEDANARLAAVVNNSYEAIISKTLAGIITSWNPGAEKVLGYAAKDVIGKPFTLVFPPELIKEEAEILTRFANGDISKYPNFETSLVRKGGKRLAVSVTLSPIKDAEGKIVGMSNILHDITQQKAAEEVRRRFEMLAASNQRLEKEIVRRKAGEESLKQSERHLSQSLEQARHHQEKLRQLTHQVLHAQEEERKRISRELHDVIAQTLSGINVQLAALKREVSLNTKSLDHNIAHTQRLVEISVAIVHQFARDLRPAVLDDLGLIPALLSYLNDFTARTGVRAHLNTFAGVEELDMARRTVLFRVAQEALANVSRHAQASRVEVTLQKLPNGVGMKIQDDGKSFSVEKTLRGKRLGLLGMRERLEMVGGKFGVESSPGQGTTIEAQIPFGNVSKRGKPRLSTTVGNKPPLLSPNEAGRADARRSAEIVPAPSATPKPSRQAGILCVSSPAVRDGH